MRIPASRSTIEMPTGLILGPDGALWASTQLGVRPASMLHLGSQEISGDRAAMDPPRICSMTEVASVHDSGPTTPFLSRCAITLRNLMENVGFHIPGVGAHSRHFDIGSVSVSSDCKQQRPRKHPANQNNGAFEDESRDRTGHPHAKPKSHGPMRTPGVCLTKWGLPASAER